MDVCADSFFNPKSTSKTPIQKKDIEIKPNYLIKPENYNLRPSNKMSRPSMKREKSLKKYDEMESLQDFVKDIDEITAEMKQATFEYAVSAVENMPCELLMNSSSFLDDPRSPGSGIVKKPLKNNN